MYTHAPQLNKNPRYSHICHWRNRVVNVCTWIQRKTDSQLLKCHTASQVCAFSLLDLSWTILPSVLHFTHKRVFDSPEAAAHLPQVPGHFANLLPDLPERLRTQRPFRGVPTGYPSLGDGVRGDLGRSANRTRLGQRLDDPEVVDQVKNQTRQHCVAFTGLTRQLQQPAVLYVL